MERRETIVVLHDYFHSIVNTDSLDKQYISATDISPLLALPDVVESSYETRIL